MEIFEDLVSRYAQQIRENEPPQVFNFTLLTIATERVSSFDDFCLITLFMHGICLQTCSQVNQI